MKFNKTSIKFLEKYLNTSSPTGFEHNGQKYGPSILSLM